MTKAAPGFTLVEILVAMVVFGFVVVGLAQGVQFGVRAWDLQARRVGAHADLDGVDRVLRGLVARMDPGSVAVAPNVDGRPSQFAFTTALPRAGGDERPQHADVALSVDDASRLLLRWTPHAHSVGAAPATAAEVVLLTGVGTVSFSYLYPDGAAASGWTDHWAESYLPRLVRVHFAFPAGDSRHWPDIVAEPAQDRPHE